MSNCTNFFKKIEELKLYIIEFDKNCTIKPKTYCFDYVIKSKNNESIIMITHNKCTFSANNIIKKA